ncbi:winged helix-turn-helix domain-containing protein [Patescibacteria group bacterium]|nr:winged helix-turn-helix domain-containing protein [Patescibacteria group bacterium]
MYRKKTYKQLERLVKGFSNHRRIQIMELLKKEPELSVLDIADELEVNFKTIAHHIKSLAMAGLVLKRYDNHSVRHKLTKNGEQILKFLRTLE